MILAAFLATRSLAQDLRPEVQGPGWRMASAEPVSPEEARRVLTRRQVPSWQQTGGVYQSETEATPEIVALARALENEPKLMFDYIHNHIDYVPTFGSVNGATGTLLAGRGNDWDQASLFIALMRASGYTADYVVGDVTYYTERLADWLGVGNVTVGTVLANGGIPATPLGGGYRITRAWVQAEIGGQTYIFDPAMKTYSEVEGLDLDSASGYERTGFMARAQEGAIVASDLAQYMNEANIRADLATYSMNLVNFIRASIPDATLAEVTGGREIVMSEMSSYLTSLPDALEVSNETIYATVPDTYRHTLRVEHEGIDHTFKSFEIAGKRVSLFYDAANSYRPVLRLDGTTIATGGATTPGWLYDLSLTVDHPYAASGGTFADQWGEMPLESGSDYVIVHDFGIASADLIASRNRLLTQYLQDGLAEDSEAVRGEALALMGLNYSYEDQLVARLLSRIGQGILIQHHLVGLVGQAAGYFIDLPLSITSVVSYGGVSTTAIYRTYAMMGSALEHGMLEQMQGSNREALSSIKVLQLNNQAGNMTFLANAGNWNAVKPLLTSYWPDDLSFIEGYINDGYTFVLPENGSINLNQWNGSGYIGYKGSDLGMWIGGGYSGGMVSWAVEIWLEALLNTLKEYDLPPDLKAETKTLENGDPVDMASGSFHWEQTDLIAGPDGLLDLSFARSYNSSSHNSLGPMGYGWSHNQNLFLAWQSDYSPGLGGRQPVDAASLIVSIKVILDVMGNEENIEGWMVADLATKWAMDQLIDNAITVHLSNTSLEYIRLPDGSASPPPGIRQALVQQGDYTYVQGGRNGCMIFDSAGRGRVWIEANGNALTYTYDGEGNLQSVSSSGPGQAQTLVFTYSDGLLAAVADGAGREVTFEYVNGELTTFQDAAGNTWQYSYDPSHRMLSVTRPQGNTVVTNAYDDLGQVSSQSDALGHMTTFYFSGFRSLELGPDGHREVLYLDEQGRTIAREDDLGQRATYTYDGQYHLRTVSDRLGGTTTYTYDPTSAQIATVTNAAGETLAYTTSPKSHLFTNPLNGETLTLTAYYVTRLDYADGSYKTLSYDSRGNLVANSDAAGNIWTYTYNTLGQVTAINNPIGGQIAYSYNADGTLASRTDSDTGLTTYGYDAYLRQNKVTYPDGSFIQTSHDLNDRLTSITDEQGETTTYTYDANGNLVKITDPLGAETNFAYNLMDLVTQETNQRGKTTLYQFDEMNRLASVTDPNGNEVQWEYDSRGLQAQITDAAGKVWQTGYNNEGLATTHSTPLGNTSTMGRDALGRPATLTGALGHTTTLAYDQRGRLAALIDPLGHATQTGYDARGLLTGVTLPDGAAASYEYDGLGSLVTIHDPGDHEWSFSYTPMGRLNSRTDPLGNQWGFNYDQQGFLAQVTLPDGDVKIMSYDTAGNLIRQQYASGLDLSYAYDPLSRLVATEGISLTYDEIGQVVESTDLATGYGFGAVYDDGGRVESISYADGLFAVTYQYNARNLLTHVSDDLTGSSVQFTYDSDGRLTGMQRSNGVDASFSWDAASRLSRIQEGSLIDLQYAYDAAGKVVQAVMDLPLDPGDYIVAGTTAYTFDAASQVSNPGYSYDAQGRLTASPEHTYTWDGASRLVGVGQDGILSYNGLGDLLTRTADGQTTRYFYNHALSLTPIVAERDETTGQFIHYYVWTPAGDLLYMIDVAGGNAVYFYHFDRAGSTLALTNQAGNLTDAYIYQPYGRLLYHQGDNAQPFTYVGKWGVRQEGDAGTFYQMRDRYYDALSGRFISREPFWPNLSNPAKLNPYQYALGDPCGLVDVTGQEELCFTNSYRAGYANYLQNTRAALWEEISWGAGTGNAKFELWRAQTDYRNFAGTASFWVKQAASYKKKYNDATEKGIVPVKFVPFGTQGDGYYIFGKGSSSQIEHWAGFYKEQMESGFAMAEENIQKALAIKACIPGLELELFEAEVRLEKLRRRLEELDRRWEALKEELAHEGEVESTLKVAATVSSSSSLFDWFAQALR